jgi:hypothetical protein
VVYTIYQLYHLMSLVSYLRKESKRLSTEV